MWISVCVIQEEVSIAKEEWELGHLKAIKEEDERRAEIEEDDMLYLSLHESSPNKSSATGKHGKSKPKLYSYGGWQFASFDDDAIASFLDDDGSQNTADDTSTEPSLVNSQLATVQQVRGRQRKRHVTKTKPSALNKMDSSTAVPGRKFWAKKRRAEFGIKDGSTEKGDAGKRLKMSPKIAKMQKLPKKVSRPVKGKAEHMAVGAVTLDVTNVRHKVRAGLVSRDVSKVPRLKAVRQVSHPTSMAQHRPLVRPIRSSELGVMRPRMMRVPASSPRSGGRTIAEIVAQSPPQPTPILEKLGATVLPNPSSMNQPSRLTQIVSSISALQNTVQYVITTNGRPAVQPVGQTPLVIGTSGTPASVGSNLRSNIVYQVPPAAGHHHLPLHAAVQSVSTVKPSQHPPRLVLPSSATSTSAARQRFVLTAPGGDRQSFVLLPTSNRQSYILAPAASSSQPSTATNTASPGVVRPTSFTVQLSPPRLPRTVQQPIQPALSSQRTIQLAPSLRTPATNTLPILEKFALQLNSTRPAVAATYEVVAHSGELIAASSPPKVSLQQIVYPTVSPPSQIVRLSGSTGTSSVQLVNHMVVGASTAKPVQTITMPQLVIRQQPRQVAAASTVIAAAPTMLPVRNQLSGPRIVSGTNLVQVPSSQLSTVIIVDSSAVSRQS